MFLLYARELLGLLGIFVQTSTAWVFAALLASLDRQEELRPALRTFIRALVALSIGDPI